MLRYPLPRSVTIAPFPSASARIACVRAASAWGLFSPHIVGNRSLADFCVLCDCQQDSRHRSEPELSIDGIRCSECDIQFIQNCSKKMFLPSSPNSSPRVFIARRMDSLRLADCSVLPPCVLSCVSLRTTDFITSLRAVSRSIILEFWRILLSCPPTTFPMPIVASVVANRTRIPSPKG